MGVAVGGEDRVGHDLLGDWALEVGRVHDKLVLLVRVLASICGSLRARFGALELPENALGWARLMQSGRASFLPDGQKASKLLFLTALLACPHG